MKFQLLKERRLYFQPGTIPENKNGVADDPILLKEWDQFFVFDILETIKEFCPDSELDLDKLIEWRIEIPELRKNIYHHLWIATTKNPMEGEFISENIVYYLDFIEENKK